MEAYRKSRNSKTIQQKNVAVLVLLIMLTMWCSFANATAVIFTDRAAFDAATGGGLSFESFETPFDRIPSITFSGFSVKEINGGNYIYHTSSSPGTIDGAVTDGNGAIFYVDNGDSIGVFFDFQNPIKAIGMDITVNPQNTLSIDIGAGVIDTLAFSNANSPKFWGVISDSVIDSVKFDGVVNLGNIGFDAVSYGVPEPCTIVMLSLGGLILRRKNSFEI